MNTSNFYKRYKEKCIELEVPVISKKQFIAIVWIIDDLRKTERTTISLMQDMCEESLSPNVFEMWAKVKEMLLNTRTQLK